MPERDIVVIGASTGGVAALQALVASLPRDFRAAAFIVQHIGASGRSLLPEILGHAGPLSVAHPRDGEPIVPGRIRIAPPDLHMVLAPPGARGANGRVRLLHGPKENYTRPAVDPLFRSAALAFGERVIGVILTGHLDDGAAGLLAIKDLGGVAVVQHPADCIAPSLHCALHARERARAGGGSPLRSARADRPVAHGYRAERSASARHPRPRCAATGTLSPC